MGQGFWLNNPFILDILAQSVQRWTTGWVVRVRFSEDARYFSLLSSVQTGSRATEPSIRLVQGNVSLR
jgi:hypothetical protein